MEKEKFSPLIEQYLSTREIAKELKISQSNVRYWLKQYGLKTRKPKKEERYCLQCNAKLVDKEKKYCSNKCQSLYNYHSFIKKWLAGETIQCSKHEGEPSGHIRRYLFEVNHSKCSQCGWSKVNKYTGKIPLTVNHVDGNSENHVPSNLELICPCCHSLTPNYGSLNRGKGRKIRLKKLQKGP